MPCFHALVLKRKIKAPVFTHMQFEGRVGGVSRLASSYRLTGCWLQATGCWLQASKHLFSYTCNSKGGWGFSPAATGDRLPATGCH